MPLDWLYGSWLPVQSLVLFPVMLARPSPAKSRALTAYSCAWFLLGVAAAVFFASAGPIFYDRLFGGTSSRALATRSPRGVWIALAESDRCGRHSPRPQAPLPGISAVPSMHVAIRLWIGLPPGGLPRARPAPLALFPAGLDRLSPVWLARPTDGLAGALGMLAIWYATPQLAPLLGRGVHSCPPRGGNPPSPRPYP